MAAARYTSQRCLERSSSLLAAAATVTVRSYSSCSTVGSASNLKVALIGAGSEAGKNMALCLKQCSLIDELALHDLGSAVNRVRKDLSRCNTTCMVSDRDDVSLDNTLLNAKIVALIVSGSNLSQEASEIERVVPKILQYCPKAFVALVARSVNSLLPMLFERYKRDGRFENDRLFGVLNYFSTQASSFAAQRLGIDPNSVNVPIVGGGCPKTAVPLFSLTTPAATFSPEELYRLRNAMKRADEKVAAEKCGEGASSSTTTEPYSWPMCAGFAAAKFCVSLCKAMKDEAGVVECAFVRSCLIPGLNYCGAPLRLGPNGIQRHLGLPKVSADECRQLEEAIPLIRRDIKVGEESMELACMTQGRRYQLCSCTTIRHDEVILISLA
uniref:Malate dehydrogenase, mitochondrial n=1 Tax=Trichogramma kaykai TaxID=54128 RepID=A0ABD2XE29_9HYME